MIRVRPIHPCRQPRCKRSASVVVEHMDNGPRPSTTSIEVCRDHVEWAKREIAKADL